MDRKRIVCFGDSLTWGFDPAKKTRFPEEFRWPVVLQKALGERYQIIEEGQCARTIATDDPAEGEKNGLSYIIPCLETHSPLEWLIILLGSNDCKRKFSYCAMDIAGEMQIFLEKVCAYNHFRCGDHMRILLIAPPVIANDVQETWLRDCFGYERSSEVSSELASWYKRLAEMYHCAFLNADEIVKTSAVDGIHLDTSAQVTLGEAVAAKIRDASEE